ncbi:MAG: hypothetical protein KJ607_07045, partial [Bacteroidetes bacterium]|nr:hypothetical protein [Bacteroidota bacterium]
MKRLANTALWFLMINLSAFAQQLSSGEYFFGSDPGQGNGTAFTFPAADSVNSAIDIDVSALSPGYHNLKLRTKNTGGIWSHYESRLFYVIDPEMLNSIQPSLSGGEYFFDTDPGQGNGTAISFNTSDSVNMTAGIPLSGLSPGFHDLYLRVRNSGGKWSHYETRLFYIVDSGTLLTDQSSLMKGEYFFDTDPGFGNGTAIAFAATDSVNIALNISTSGLATGTHHIYIRTRNANGKWSHYEKHEFQICTSVNAGSAEIYNQSGFPYACEGHIEVFLAVLQNEGSEPVFEWKLNGLPVSAESSFTSGTDLVTGDELILA